MKKSIYFIIIGAILVIGAVVFLVYNSAQRSKEKEPQNNQKSNKEQVKNEDQKQFQGQTGREHQIPDFSIAYVELDSIIEHYSMTKDLTGELEVKMKKMESDLSNRERKLQANLNDFQNKATKGLETRSRLAEMEQQLAVENQNLMQLAERYRMEMAEEHSVMQRKIIQSIMDYLKEYNKEKGYKYILGNAFDAKILYADPSLNITADVLRGLNAQYKK